MDPWTLGGGGLLMPHAHKLVQCVAIENTLKILKNTHAPRP